MTNCERWFEEGVSVAGNNIHADCLDYCNYQLETCPVCGQTLDGATERTTPICDTCFACRDCGCVCDTIAEDDDGD